MNRCENKKGRKAFPVVLKYEKGVVKKINNNNKNFRSDANLRSGSLMN